MSRLWHFSSMSARCVCCRLAENQSVVSCDCRLERLTNQKHRRRDALYFCPCYSLLGFDFLFVKFDHNSKHLGIQTCFKTCGAKLTVCLNTRKTTFKKPQCKITTYLVKIVDAYASTQSLTMTKCVSYYVENANFFFLVFQILIY